MVLLGRSFDKVKWFALTLLFFGVTLVQLDEAANKPGKPEK
jgi:multidrug transporter EmrE-like cation transporter